MRTALLFPGQGAPAAAWRGAVADLCPDLLQHARELLGGEDPFECFGAGTEFDQPATYCASITAFEAAGRPSAEFHAGHSMGEISALACAGAFAEHDGLRIVVERGRLMAAAGRSAGSGMMLAARAPAADLESMAARHNVVIANLNSPSQTVLSGAEGAIERVGAELSERGVLTKQLPVTGAFHSPRMAAAALALKKVLAGFEISTPRVPVLSGRAGMPFTDIPSDLAASLIDPVRWIDVVATLEREGVERFIEVGPGKALAGLVRKSVRGATVETTRIPESAGA